MSFHRTFIFYIFFSLIVTLKLLPMTARRKLSFTPNNPLPTEKKLLMTTNSRSKTKKFCASAQRKIAENISIRRKFGHFKIMLVFYIITIVAFWFWKCGKKMNFSDLMLFIFLFLLKVLEKLNWAHLSHRN